MDLPDEVHLALLALGAPSDGIVFMTEAEAARIRAHLDATVAAAEMTIKKGRHQ